MIHSKINLTWFKRVGPFFIPISLIGWILLLGGLAYAVYLFFEVNSMDHSVTDKLIVYIFNLLLISAVYSLVAYLTRRKFKK